MKNVEYALLFNKLIIFSLAVLSICGQLLDSLDKTIFKINVDLATKKKEQVLTRKTHNYGIHWAYDIN